MAFTSHHLYLDDLDVGAVFESGGRTVTQADISNFAGFSGDYNAIHIDHEFAKGTPYRQVICHGFGVFSIASGQSVQSPPTRIIAMARVNYWDFKFPVFIGDTIRLRSTVKSKTIKGVGKRGELIWFRQILNQENKVVQEGEIVTIIECRPKTVPSATEATPTA